MEALEGGGGGDTRTIDEAEAEAEAPSSVSTGDEIALITSAMNFRTAECLSKSSREWTDEKHSLYLESMEASFVNQLYESRSSKQNRNRPSGQFKILQAGSWDKISFERPEYGNKTGKVHVLAADPWIRRLRPQRNAPSKTDQQQITEKICRSDSSSKRSHLCHEPSRDTEMCDQNFVDDDDDDAVKGPNECSSSKRMRTVAATSAQDQVGCSISRPHLLELINQIKVSSTPATREMTYSQGNLCIS